MSTYQHSIDIAAPADDVYGFISDPWNLPRILPLVNEVESSARRGSPSSPATDAPKPRFIEIPARVR